MTRRIFLFGDQADNFAETSRPFIEAAGGNRARVALLAQGPESGAYVNKFTIPWRDWGVAVMMIAPLVRGGELSATAVAEIAQCSAIYICGGVTTTYQRLYTDPSVRDVIRDMYQQGIPYAGVSAGALLVTARCAVSGEVVRNERNEYFVRTSLLCEKATEAEPLTIRLGLGLLPACATEPHFSERGGFPRLMAVMDMTDTHTGLGMDEPICLAIEDERKVAVSGKGRAYHLHRIAPRKFEVQIYEPDEYFSI